MVIFSWWSLCYFSYHYFWSYFTNIPYIPKNLFRINSNLLLSQNSRVWIVWWNASTSTSWTSVNINSRLNFIWNLLCNANYSFLTRRNKRLWWNSRYTSFIFQLFYRAVSDWYILYSLKTKVYKLFFFLSYNYIQFFSYVYCFFKCL